MPIIGAFFEYTSNNEMIRIAPGHQSHRVIRSFGREISVPEQVIPYEIRAEDSQWIGGLEYNSGVLVLSDHLYEIHSAFVKKMSAAILAQVVDKAPQP